MSLLKFYGAIPLVSLAYQAVRIPYAKWKTWRTKEPEWDEKNALPNFIHLSQSTSSEQLMSRIAPKRISNLTPYLHQGHLGVESQEESDKAVQDIIQIGGLVSGGAAFFLPILRYFSRCLANDSFAACAKNGAEDLFSYSTLPLLAGAFLVSQATQIFFFAPLIGSLSADMMQPQRQLLLKVEYKKMEKALAEALDRPADDPFFSTVADAARKFLRLAPQIEKEIHSHLSIDAEFAKELLLPLQVACRQIAAKAKEAPLPKPENQKSSPSSTDREPSRSPQRSSPSSQG